MIQGHDIICFSNDWDGDPLSKKHIMVRLAKRNRILWVNSIGLRAPTASVRDVRRVAKKLRDFSRGCRRVADNIYALSPVALPFYGRRWVRRVNRHGLRWTLQRACRTLGFRRPITWSFLPASADIAGTLDEQLVVYHCVDEFSEFTGTDRTAILDMERTLIGKADVVIVSSHPLFEAKHRYNANTFLVTHGVDVEHFRKACDPRTAVPADLVALPRPVVGFYGLIADWVDLPLVRFLASAKPHWTFALIGKLDTDPSPLRGLPNVHLLGRKDYQALPAYCRGFDVAIVPFAVNALTRAANPLKLREYLAAGLPVVTVAIPEAERLAGLVRVARSERHFLEELQAVLVDGKGGPQLSLSRAMDRESWDDKVEELSRIIAGRLAVAGAATSRHRPARINS